MYSCPNIIGFSPIESEAEKTLEICRYVKFGMLVIVRMVSPFMAKKSNSGSEQSGALVALYCRRWLWLASSKGPLLLFIYQVSSSVLLKETCAHLNLVPPHISIAC